MIAAGRPGPEEGIILPTAVLDDRGKGAAYVREEQPSAGNRGRPLDFDGVGGAEAFARIFCIPEQAGYSRAALIILDSETSPGSDQAEPRPARWDCAIELNPFGGDFSRGARCSGQGGGEILQPLALGSKRLVACAQSFDPSSLLLEAAWGGWRR